MTSASCKKKAGILVSGRVDHEMVAGVNFELTSWIRERLYCDYLLIYEMQRLVTWLWPPRTFESRYPGIVSLWIDSTL